MLLESGVLKPDAEAMKTPPDVWSISADSFPADECSSDQLEFLLGYAILAPSTHNTQPWLFRINPTDVEIFTDPRRTLPVVDPDGRERVMSAGAALFNLRVAAEYFGHAYRVDVLPDRDHPNLLARLQLGLRGDTSSEDVMLFQALTRRRTNRTPYLPDPIPEELVTEMVEAAEHEGAWLVLADTEEARAAVADLVAEADRIQWANRAFRQELAAWVRSHPGAHADGLAGHSLGIQDWLSFAGPSIIRTFDRGGGQAARDRDIALHSPAIAILGTEDDDVAAWLAAGQALEHVLLTACANDLCTSFLNQPVEVPELRERMASWTGRPGAPRAVIRMGRGSDVPPTPRRGVRELLVHHQTGHS